MKKIMKYAVSILAVVVGLSLVANAATTTTVTNRGEVIVLKTLANVATDANAGTYQDFSVYPTRIGQVGKIVRFYDYALCGGSGTNITLLPAVAIPDNTLVRNGYTQVLTACAPATTNTIRLNASADILGSGTNTIDQASGTRAAIIPVGTAATAVQATADRLLKLELSSGTLTAGVFMVVLDCELAP